jgi:hypothetical protein
MDNNVGPATQGKLGTVLPGLESILVVEVVQRLPIVESLIAVLYWSDIGRKEVREET